MDNNQQVLLQHNQLFNLQACYVREKVTNATSYGSFSIFKRNENVAASAVAKNMREVGKQMKERIGDIFHPSRRPPK